MLFDHHPPSNKIGSDKMREISLPVILSLMLTCRIIVTLFMFACNVNASPYVDLRSRSSEATFNLLDKNLINVHSLILFM